MGDSETVSEKLEPIEKKEVDLDEALDVAGFGYYNLKYCLLFALFLIASIMEVIGYSYILPAAKCDLNMTVAQRGFIASMPYIVIVITSFPWGYIVDTRGRKYTLALSAIGTGIFGILSGFMPNLTSFIICKLLANIFIACPSAVPYAFMGELIPKKHRDIALSVTNGLQMSGATLVPLLAWGILPLDFKFDFGLYPYRAWRLLCSLYSILFLISGTIMLFGPESPKYLLSQGRIPEALKVIQTIYVGNHGGTASDCPVKMLKPSETETSKRSGFITSIRTQVVPVVTPPYLKWLLLNGFLLFGIFATLNGLFMWVPDIMNRVFTGASSGSMTACEIIRLGFHNVTEVVEPMCDDRIDTSTSSINAVASAVCAILAFLCSLSLKVINKRTLMQIIYFVFGAFCIAINFIRMEMLFVVLLVSLQISAVGIGPINAYAVEIFPTQLRGMAVSLALMFGRCGSAIGTNVAGVLINNACEGTFYGFGGLLIVCGILTFLLPLKRKESSS